MPPLTFASVFALSIVGAVTQAVCGFGYGPVTMSLMPYLLPYFQAVAISGLSGSTAAFIVVMSGYRHINWKLLFPCEITALPAGALAAYISARAPNSTMVHCLGLMMIALGVYSIFFTGKIHIRGTTRNGMIAGLLAGLSSGFFAVGGPPIAIYMIEAAKDNNEYRATLNMHFCFMTLMTTGTRWYNGAFTPPIIRMYLMILVTLFIGAWLGNKIFHKLDAKKLRLIVYSYLIISGIMMLFR